MDKIVTTHKSAAHAQHTLRTLNVIKEVPGIAKRIQVNIAYERVPDLTYTKAIEFEHNLEAMIKSALFDLSPESQQLPDTDTVDLIPIEKAMHITKHQTRKAFVSWRLRYNSRYPHARIVYRNELVDQVTLVRALRIQSGEVAA